MNRESPDFEINIPDEQLDGHHTKEEVDMAFAYAPEILRQMRKAGRKLPSVTLHADASGVLHFGPGDITDAQYDLAVSLVHSTRPDMFGKDPGIVSCCGFVTAAKDAFGATEEAQK